MNGHVFDPSAWSGAAALVWLGWALLGALLGLLHFGTLRLNTRWWLGQGEAHPPRPLAALGLQLLRLGVTGAGLLGVVRGGGALGLVAAVVGLTLARSWVMRRAKRRLDGPGAAAPAAAQGAEVQP